MRDSTRFASWLARSKFRSSARGSFSSYSVARPTILLVFLALLIGLPLGGCSLNATPAVRPGRVHPLSWTGVASWYGAKYHGRTTASGRVYNMNELTAAHKTLPFGTRLEVIHQSNGRRVVVEITDRGPFIGGREIDLSYEAARQLAMVAEGVAKVRLSKLD